MSRYAITGSIGTGKSTVAEMFSKKGLRIYDADKIVHDLYQDEEILKQVEKIIPAGFSNGEMNNKVVADIIFHDSEKKKKLEELIHPLVKERILQLDDCIIEVPLLFESKMESLFDKTILVYCSKEEQLKRIMMRDSVTKEDALSRIKSQMDIEEKKKLSDLIIYNDGDINNLEKQIDDIIKKL